MYLKKICSIFLIVSLNLSSLCFSQEQNVVFLNAGSITPYAGYLFTPQKTLELRNTTIERDNYKLLNDSLQKSLELEKQVSDMNTQKVKLLAEQNDKLAITLEQTRNTSEWTKALWFILGITATGMALYGASKVTK